MTNVARTEQEWDVLYTRFIEIRNRYLELRHTKGCNVDIALAFTFGPLLVRYLNGERSEQLFEEMSRVE